MKILILEDVPTDAELALNQIKHVIPKFDYLVVDNEPDFINALNNYKPDLIISDYSLPNYDGLSALKTSKEISPLTPFIIVTGSVNEETAVECMKTGAADYVIKDHIVRLGSSVITALTKKELVIKTFESEREIKKLNRIYSLLSNTNKVIVRVKEEQKLFDEFCRIAVEFGKFKMAWIGIVNNETQQVEVNTSYGVVDNYLQNININLSDENSNQVPMGLSILNKSYFIDNDIEKSNYSAPWKVKTLFSGFKSSAAFPIKKFETVIGAFTIYSDEINFFQNEEISLLDEMAKDISYAIENIEIQKQHKESVDKLKENEERLRLSLTAANQGLYDLNIKTGEAVVNDIYATMLGYNPKTFKETNSNWIERLHPDDKEQVAKVYNEYTSGKINEYNVEFRQKTFDGNWKWILSLGKTIEFDSDGNHLRMLGTHTDITEKKESENKLLESEKKYKYLFEHNPQPMWIYDLDSLKFLDINETTISTYGYSREEFLNMTILDLRPKSEHEKLLNNVNSVNEKIQNSGPWIHQLKNGKIIYVTIASHNILFEGRNARMVISNDVSENYKLQKELESSEQKFRKLFEKHSAIKYILDPENGDIIDANEAAVKFYGWSKDELRKMNISQINTLLLGEIKLLINKVTKNEENHFEFKHRKANGEIVDVEVFSSKIEIEDKELLHSIVIDISEKKKAEKSLIENEKRYRSVVESLNQAYYEADLRGNFTYCNPGIFILGGFTEEDVKNISSFSLVANEDRKRILTIYKGAVRNKETDINTEFRVQKKDGTKVWAEQVTHLTYDDKGNFVKATNTIREIHQRKLTEEKLLLLNRAIEQSSVSIIITDSSGLIEYVNPKFTNVTGYTFNEVLGKNPSILSSGKQSKEFYDSMWNTISSGNTWEGQFQNKKKNGELFWEDVIISPIVNNDNKITHFVAVKEDITLSKKMKEDLENSEFRFKSVWNSASEGMRLLDENGIIVDVNKSFTDLFEISYVEIISKPFTILYNDYNKNKVLNNFINKFQTKKFESHFEIEIKLHNGKKKWFSVSNSFIEDKNNNKLLLSIFTDITEKKKMIIELTEAKDKAEEMNKVKSSFFANMSHELRTPLIGILGFSELLEEDFKDKPDTFDMISNINKSGIRLLDTLNLILNISKIESSKTKFKLEERNIIPLISESVNLYKGIALNKGIQLNYINNNEIIKCPIDEGLFHHVLNNIINNAIKFTQEGSITISNKIVGNNVLINIKDTGIGIPEDKIDLIWEEFRQVSEGFTRSFEGSGLGLTIAKKYTELMNGTVTVASKENEGSTFTIKFPLAVSQAIKEPEVITEIFDEINIKTDKKINILYVEDDFIAAKLVKRILGDIYNLDFAENGDEAIKKFNNKIYDGFLMDINLKKGMDGVMVTQLIREKPEYKSTPIIAITAYTMDGDKEDFLAKGMTHYISKPYTKNNLISLVNEVFINK